MQDSLTTETTENVDSTYVDNAGSTENSGTNDSLYSGDTNTPESEVSDSVFYDTTTDQTTTDQTEIDQTTTDQTEIDQTTTDQTEVDQTTTDQTEIDQTTTDQTEVDQTTTDQTEVDQTTTDQTEVDQTTTDQTEVDQTTTDQTEVDQDTTVVAENGGNVINVDNDFGGDLKSAIAAASDGDIVELGNNTYSASGVTIDKDITLDGQDGTVIDGGGSSEPILNITQDADGATIQDLELTNANIGINSYGATDLTLQNLDINNIGISQPNTDGQNNTGINLDSADGFQVLNSTISNVGRKGIGVGDTRGGTISGITVQGVNLAAQHPQNHDAGGAKFFNTTDVTLRDSSFSNINAHFIWNDTTHGTTIENNTAQGVGNDYIGYGSNSSIGLPIYGLYNEKSEDSYVSNNNISAIDGFTAFNSTEFSTQTQSLDTNEFSSLETGSTDYYANEQAEILVATTEDPSQAGFELFAAEYNSQ
ncbi:hypothetical protein C7B62_09720 [Pleurocapsa sp. CCALA 161]|uniref:right-handed parallel beta-helix repeat-containing protein n=1 Tax=Pleurocapsa sp. CCALA 161 TaxID=2107688 RepID=UPI000D04C603|nr:hypothetical protein [Pleurocapsa sp. CCALA 161]PSB10396.1 hypothetical protein C7B62_09720 [Pleurocapsa sp. CCALA 161]